MNGIKFSCSVTLVSVLVLGGLIVEKPQLTLGQPVPTTDRPSRPEPAGPRYRAPDIPSLGEPTRSEPRLRSGDLETEDYGGCFVSGQKPLTALLPKNNFGLTTAQTPTFFVYIPQTTAQKAEFVLTTETGDVVYETSVALSQTAGVVEIQLPPSTALELNKRYEWSVSVNCNIEGFDNPLIYGEVQRVQPNSTLTQQLQNTQAQQQVAFYAEAGIWYDSVTLLAQLRRSSPGDTTLAQDWRSLLDSAGLDAFASEPIIQPQQ